MLFVVVDVTSVDVAVAATIAVSAACLLQLCCIVYGAFGRGVCIWLVMHAKTASCFIAKGRSQDNILITAYIYFHFNITLLMPFAVENSVRQNILALLVYEFYLLAWFAFDHFSLHTHVHSHFSLIF